MTDKSIQIAVITNDPERAEVIETTSNQQGWRVDANSGHMQPLTWLLAQAADIALVDIDIPNAIRLVADISKAAPNLALLALVTPERLVDMQPIIMAGAQDFVALPLNPEHYKAVIERALNSKIPIPQEQSVNAVPAHEAMAEYAVPHDDIPSTHPLAAASEAPFSAERELPDVVENELLGEPRSLIGHDAIGAQEQIVETENYTPPEIFDDVEPPMQDWVPMHDAVARQEDVASQEDVPFHPTAAEEPRIVEDADSVEQYAPALPGETFSMADEIPNNHTLPVNGAAPNILDELSEIGVNGHRQPQAIVEDVLENNFADDGSTSSTALVKMGDSNNGSYFEPSSMASSPLPAAPSSGRRLIAVVGLRGGVGRSTIAANLALAISKPDTGSVALVEAHHNLSHLSLMLHLHPRNTIAGLAEAKSLDLDIVQGHLQSHGSGINVLAAPSHLDDLVELSGEQWGTTLSMIRELSPMVVVDTGAMVDAPLLETLVLATDIIVVMNPEIASLRATTALVNSLYTESEVQGKIHVVLNRSGVGGGLDEGTIRKQLGHELTATLPDDPGLATYAMNRGVPFVHSHARSLLTKRVKALANKVVLGSDAPEETKLSARSLLPFLNSFG